MTLDEIEKQVARRLEGKTAFVTGGGAGIGRGIALALAGAGAAVAVVDIDLDALQRAAEVADGGGTAVAYRCDISDRPLVNAAMREFVADVGRLDVLVNNAGMLGQLDAINEYNSNHRCATRLIGCISGRCPRTGTRRSTYRADP